MLEFTISNIDKVIELFQAQSAGVVDMMRKGVLQGMEYFSGDFIKTQLSGRKSSDFGLRVRTGTLRNSWTVRGQGEGIEDFSAKLSTWVKYAAIHQYSGYTGKGHKAFIPKRIYLIEAFANDGYTFITKAMTKQLSGLLFFRNQHPF